MDHRELSERFIEMRKHQISTHGRVFNDTDRKVSEIVFNAAIKAIDNVKNGVRTPSIQAVPLGTGLGKSSSAYALIATFAQQDQNFTAAYIVPTIKLAVEAQEGIETLLGVGSTTLYSSFHKINGVNARSALDGLGFIPTRLVNRVYLMVDRIVILTHEELKRQLRAGSMEGATHCNCIPRSLVFIDEHPELLTQVHSTPGAIQNFHDQLLKYDRNHAWRSVLSSAAHAMSKITDTDGQCFVTAELIQDKDKYIFEYTTKPSLWDMTDPTTSTELRQIAVTKMEHTIAFLNAAAQGRAFYSRKDHEFTAYSLHIGADYPGFVLLDATCDLAGLVTLNQHVNLANTTTISYEKLQVYSLEMPRKFCDMHEVTKITSTGLAYGKYIRESVLANTKIGDDVLIVTHKYVIAQELLGIASEDPNSPMNDWEGRNVNILNWGAGVGSNSFRAKTHVFLFGEYHVPRSVTIAQTHGWAQLEMNDGELKNAEGHRRYNQTYSPTAAYGQVHDGQVLRWIKQLAMRGRARCIDASGRCLPMKLFLTLERQMLIPYMPVLFPGAPMPSPAEQLAPANQEQVKGRQGLLNLAMESKLSCMSAEHIQSHTGIPTNNLKREYVALEEIFKLLGWSLKSAAELGLSGRMRYLARCEQLYRENLIA